jgi:hypothetical protein
MAGIFDFGDEVSSTPQMQGAQQVPLASFGDVVKESYGDFMLSRRFNADRYYLEGGPFSQGQFDKRRDTFKELTGGGSLLGEALASEGKIDDKTRYSNVVYSRINQGWKDTVNNYITKLREQDPEKFKNILTDAELKDQYIQEAKAQREKFETTVQGATDTAQTLGPIVGGIGASFFDPINVATLPLGAASKAGILATMAAEAGINMAATAATIPEQMRLEDMLGREYTAQDAFLELSTAGAFGAVFGGVSKSLGKVIDKRIGVQQELIDNLLDGGDVDGATSLKAAQTEYLTNSYDLSPYFDSPLSRTLDKQVQSYLYGDAGFKPLKVTDDGQVIPRGDLQDSGLNAIDLAYRTERLTFQEAQIEAKKAQLKEAEDIYNFKLKSINEEQFQPDPDLTKALNNEARLKFEETKPQRINEAFKEKTARVESINAQYKDKLAAGVSANLKKQDDAVNAYLKSKKSNTDKLIAQGQRNLKEEINGINKARKDELLNVSKDLDQRLKQAEIDSTDQNLSRKAKKHAVKNLPKTQDKIRAEYDEISKNVNQIYDEQISIATARQKEIDAFNYQRSKAYQWDKDIAEVQSAIDEQRPINPANITLDENIIMGMNPKRVTNLVARRQLIEFQDLNTKASQNDDIPTRSQAEINQTKVLSELVFNTNTPRDANIKSVLEISRINDSQKMKLEELDRVNQIDPNETVFLDGEIDSKGQYRTETQETAGKIASDYDEALKLRGILESCGLGSSGGNE